MALCISLLRYLLDLGDSLGDGDEDEPGEKEGERRFDFPRFVFECLCLFLCLSGVTSTELLTIVFFFAVAARLLTLTVAAWAARAAAQAALVASIMRCSNDISFCSNRSW